jgi:hypothetical protein
MDRRRARKNRILFQKSITKMATKSNYTKTKTGDLDVENLENQRKIIDQMKNLFLNNINSLNAEQMVFNPNQNQNILNSLKVSFDLGNDTNKLGVFNKAMSRQVTNSEKIVNALKGWMENSKTSSALKGKTNSGNVMYIDDIFLEMDKIKSFDHYFHYNNIENIIEKYEFLKKKNQIKTKKRTATRLKLFKEKSSFNYDVMGLKRGSLLGKDENLEDILSKPEAIKQAKNTVMRKNFFKNAPYIEKLMQEELFDPQKIKDFYKNKYQKEKKKNLLSFFKALIVNLFAIFCYCCKKKNQKTKAKTKKKLSYLDQK